MSCVVFESVHEKIEFSDLNSFLVHSAVPLQARGAQRVPGS